MILHRLIVRKTKPTHEIIRDILFKPSGLNLIIDNTSAIAEDSGNNVGKTTALKIIDLCLGAKSPRILYYDDDTKTENIIIRDFLHNNAVEAELHIFDPESKTIITIVRHLFNKGKNLIDGIELTEREYNDKLKDILFGLKEPFPTLRQLVPKFIRVNDGTTEKMIKYLSGPVPNDVYDTIYLFLFKLLSEDLLSKKEIIAMNLRDAVKKLEYFQKDANISSLDSLEQRKGIIDRDLAGVKDKRQQLDYMEKYKDELAKKRNLLNRIEQLEQKIQQIELDIILINKGIDKLHNEKSNIDVSKISRVYGEAVTYLSNLTKTFDDVVSFHNSMIHNRIVFMSRQLAARKEEQEVLLQQRELAFAESRQISVELLDEGLLNELNGLNTQIENLNIEKGKIIKSIDILSGAEKQIKDFQASIDEISIQISAKSIVEKMSIFNEYFSVYCEALYGEKYLFVYNNNWKTAKNFPVSVDQFKGNVGTGKKKGVIVAFDLAYMKYADMMHIKAPMFVIHDKLESTHINQLGTIFDLCKGINGQYIIAILRERVGTISSNIIDDAKILELSTGDKFFKVL